MTDHESQILSMKLQIEQLERLVEEHTVQLDWLVVKMIEDKKQRQEERLERLSEIKKYE